MNKTVCIGLDIGSTTAKTVILEDDRVVFRHYARHYSRLKESIIAILDQAEKICGSKPVMFCLTGSCARTLAEKSGIPFTQEVVANSIAVKKLYPKTGTAVELGGQDAKIIFFRPDSDGNAEVFDMRMNGSCAGGTGAFIDEIAGIIDVPAEKLNGYAEKGTCVYDISGRCGVFAKTDIQPLLNQGAGKEDIALSGYHAIAKQTIGGLAQGLDITAPVIFEGGPFSYHPAMIQVFRERLGLSEKDIIVPEHPETMVAFGAALSCSTLHAAAGSRPLGYFREIFSAYSGDDESVTATAEPFFSSEKEKEEFSERHRLGPVPEYKPEKGETVSAYLGIDAGSTTVKFVLADESGNIISSFYSGSNGNPLEITRRALVGLYDRYRASGATLRIIAAASTGYGENLFSRAFHTETHVIETIAHAEAASRFAGNPSFVLDIGGQDMKAIWLDNGIITNIVVNEACSSGCGSFLENFAETINIKACDIASHAFASRNPAKLGSRCTVFMNSSIITAQRSGKTPDDIMAGLCRSLVENVFTKVIRLPSLSSLGDSIVVQGGTFLNDAVLRALEQYTGLSVTRAPYPGLMGALGAALSARDYHISCGDFRRTFLSYDELKDFSYTSDADSVCPFCSNHCKRNILHFSTGDTWVTNNRCEKGEILEDSKSPEAREKLYELSHREKPFNMFSERQKLLLADYPYRQLCATQDDIIGLPLVLYNWEELPFWNTFFRSLGFRTVISGISTRKIYESGLHAVPSDTECFPAKLVHGHIRELAKLGATRIFMPSVSTMPPENTEKISFSRCALVKGYPIVIANSDNPGKTSGIPYDSPYFYFYRPKDFEIQLTKYVRETYGIPRNVSIKAVRYAMQAQKDFERLLKESGQKHLDEINRENRKAVILAARPYHSDPLVNHEIPEMLVSMGLPVFTVDSLPEMNSLDLSKSRLDIVNNYHARVLEGAIIAARNPNLELVQLVSFGCGHDACLSDEAVRIMKEISSKAPLILKTDESDAQGPLRIRIRSFAETIRKKNTPGVSFSAENLKDPYPVKFDRKAKKQRTVLFPNSSHAFSMLMAAAFSSQNIKAVSLDYGKDEAVKLAKQFTHNDICFPAQIVTGEILDALKNGGYDPEKTAVFMAKYSCCCRLTHYTAILRKAMNDNGFENIPIITNDDKDYHNIHPGFRISIFSALRVAFGLPMIDALEEIRLKKRPYEKIKGSTDEAYEAALEILMRHLAKGGIPGAIRGFRKALAVMNKVAFDNTVRRPRVLVVGEYLMNFHPTANNHIEEYLEKNGFEITEAKMSYVIQKFYFCNDHQVSENRASRPLDVKIMLHAASFAFEFARKVTDFVMRKEPLHEKNLSFAALTEGSDEIMYHTFDTGEGVLIPAEIIHNAKNGCRHFIILQPWGCLPNHVIGRGIVKKYKEIFPDIKILPLDYDPDASFANIENRIQMFAMDIYEK